MSQQQVRIIHIPLIPRTTAGTIIFPWKGDMFKSDSYSLGLSNDQFLSEEGYQFFSKIHSVFQNPLSEEDRRRLNEFSLRRRCLFSFVVLFIIYWVVPTNFIEMLTTQETVFLSVVFVSYIGLSMFWSQLNEIFQPHPLDFKFEKCQDIADEHNEILRSRGLKWGLSGFPHWIELTKDLKKQAYKFQVNTEEKITFNLMRGRYSKDFYLPQMTDERISHEEMYQMISKINADLRRPFRRLNPMGFAFCGAFYVVFLIWLKIFESIPEMWAFLFGFALFLILLVIPVGIFIWVDSRFQETFKVKYTADFQRYIRELNENLKSRGLRWSLPNEFPDSIELCKDYMNQNLSSQEIDTPLYSQERNSNKKLGKNKYAPLPEHED